MVKTERPDLFFVGLNPRWQSYKFLPKGLNVMYSALGFWDMNDRVWRKGQKFKKAYGLRFLDCGGFLVLMKYGDYPYTVTNYANLVVRLNPDFYAPLDYACEPELTVKSKATVKERIHSTIDNTLELLDYGSQLPGKLIPVIQGYTIDEYMYCVDLMAKEGLISNYMAVGSMCRRFTHKELGTYISRIYHRLQSEGCNKLHFFGLKLDKRLMDFSSMIYSRDSSTTFMNHRMTFGKEKRRFPRGQDEKKILFNHFLDNVTTMRLKYRVTSPERKMILNHLTHHKETGGLEHVHS